MDKADELTEIAQEILGILVKRGVNLFEGLGVLEAVKSQLYQQANKK